MGLGGENGYEGIGETVHPVDVAKRGFKSHHIQLMGTRATTKTYVGVEGMVTHQGSSNLPVPTYGDVVK